MSPVLYQDRARKAFRLALCLLAFVLALGLFRLGIGEAFAANPFGMFSIGTEGSMTLNGSASSVSMQNVVIKYRNIALAITSFLTITMLIFMLLQFTKLGAAGDNEMQRKKAIMGILTTGIATALLGGATIVVGFFWNVLTKTKSTP